jgi:quercetin dioxygenase-like cupin family protein
MIDETAIRVLLEREADSAYQWTNGPGTVCGSHSHTYRKILYCLHGSIRFDLVASGEAIELKPGDRLDLAPGTPHAAVVGPGGVTCIEGQARLTGA